MSDTSFKIKKSMEWHPQATAPVNPAEGETYFDSVSGKLLQYKGGLWKPLGGGLDTVETTYASPPPNPMASGSHYLIDMTSACGNLTVRLPAGAAGDVIRVSVWGQSTSGKYVTVIPNGAEIIWYNETSNASKIIGQTSNWTEFIFDVGKGWITNDSSSGSGQGKKNYILNPSAAVLETTYWTSSNFTVTRDTSTSIPRETTTKSAFRLVSTNTNATFTTDAMLLDDVDLNKKLGGEIAINVADASNWTIEVQASATSGGSYVALPLSTDVSSVTTLPATTGVFKFNFDTVASTPYIKFQIKSATTAKTAYFSDILLSPDSNTVSGTVITDWKSYSAINWASGVEFSSSHYRRVGSNIEVTGLIELSGAAPSDLTISLPTGLTIDSTIMTGARADVGIWSYRDYDVSQRFRTADISSPYSGLHVYILSLASNKLYLGGNENIVNPGWPITWADGDKITFTFSVPIAEWAGSGTVNLAQNDVEYAYNSDDSGADDTTSFAYGFTGVRFPNRAVGITVSKTVKFQYPIQPGEVYQLQYTDGNNRWQTCDSRFPYMRQNTSVYGFDMYQTSSTTIIVRFGAQGAMASGATYGANGTGWDTFYTSGWRWRVVKHRAGAAVGFGIVNPGVSAGLVSANGLPGRTDGVAVGAGYVGEEAELATGVATCNGVSDTLVVTKTLDVGTWLVIASTNAAVSNAQTGHKSTIGIKGTVGSVSGYDTCTFDAKTNNSWGTINFPNRVVTIASDDADKTIKLYDVAIGADQSYSCRGNISAIRIA
jgi:hypothetical protein